MSAGAGMPDPLSPPKRRPTVPPRPTGKPSLRWRIRRWILKKLDAWPRERPEPRTEWAMMRRRDRMRLTMEADRLRSLAPTDDEIRALIRSVAQATAELVAEEYDSPAELWAERRQVADRMVDVFMESAEELPASEVHAMRRMRT